MIPKIFHWIWLGKEEIPEDHLHNIESWIRLHPTWDAILWMDNPELQKRLSPFIDARLISKPINNKYFQSIENWVGDRGRIVAQSDILRLELICLHGGIYLDTDVICFKNIEGLLENVTLCVAETYFDGISGHFGSFFFGAYKNHPAMWNLVRNLGITLEKEKVRMDDERTKNGGKCHLVNQVFIPGPHYLCKELITFPECVIFPFRIGNPLAQWQDKNQVVSWPEESYFNHNFEGSWLSDDRVKLPPPDEFLR